MAKETQAAIGLGGGSYGLIGVGLAVASWGTSWFWATLSGLFWPVTWGYWFTQALHQWAGG